MAPVRFENRRPRIVTDRSSGPSHTTATSARNSSPDPFPPSRLVSLDAFRGLAIAGMILVNNPGNWGEVYWPLLHAEWDGWTPTDLVFPFFLFLVGVSMVLSFEARQKRGATRSSLVGHVARRSAILVFLGLFLAAFPFFHLETLRYPGVLQRIGVCYLCASVVYLFLKRRGRVGTILGLLFGYWALLALVPVPGWGAGRLDAEGNLAAYIDRALMLGHLWKPTWDPEGLLSTLPAVATTLLGTLAGEWITSVRAPRIKVTGLLAAGALGLAAGEIWHFWFPINKNLWTSSYVIFTGGFAAVLLGLCYWVIDVKGRRRWATPLVVFGTNAIAVFFLSGLLARVLGVWKVAGPGGQALVAKAYLYQQFFAPLGSAKNASLLFALAYVAFWWALMWILYRRKVFIKI